MKKTAIEILKNHGWYDPNVDAGNYRIPMPYVLDFMEEYASQSKLDGEKTVEQYYIEQINPDAEKFKTDPIHKRIIQLIKGYADLKSGNKLDVVEVENVLLKALGNFDAYSGVPRYRQYAEAICNHFSSQSTPAKVEDVEVILTPFGKSIGLLRDLADIQNGAPLEQHKKEWEEIMDRTYKFLNLWENPLPTTNP